MIRKCKKAEVGVEDVDDIVSNGSLLLPAAARRCCLPACFSATTIVETAFLRVGCVVRSAPLLLMVCMLAPAA